LRALYFPLVHSHICYGLLAWGNCNVKTLHRTALLQKRAIRTINNAKFKSYWPFIQSYNIMKITDQNIFQSALFVFDITKCLPYSFEQIFRFSHDIPNSRATRQSDLLYETECKTNFANKLLLYAIPKIWNKWFHTLPQNRSRSKFKNVMRANNFSSYQSRVTCFNSSLCPDCIPQASRAWEKYILQLFLACPVMFCCYTLYFGVFWILLKLLGYIYIQIFIFLFYVRVAGW